MLLSQPIKVLPPNAKFLCNAKVTPEEVAMAWPNDIPLMALMANGLDNNWSRWSILAPATNRQFISNDKDVIEKISQLVDNDGQTTLLPNWIGYLSYECGHAIEPITGKLVTKNWPLAHLIWCDTALIYDHIKNQWWSIGEIDLPICHARVSSKWQCSPLENNEGDLKFKDDVEKTVKYIHKGDIFQANITRRFTTKISGNIRNAAMSALKKPGGWFGAWFEFSEHGRYLLSMSPELFLCVDGSSRRIITRPMKGTRPEKEDPIQLMASQKDAAELHMIVDLMRNDLGKICQFGTIQVRQARSIEKHPTVWQCVGEIEGQLNANASTQQILEATFPPGSITGAPKIRAMQIINELEKSPRGPYCGAIGVFGKSIFLNVAIRTATLTGTHSPVDFKGKLEYRTGCGIVSDSNAIEELHESEVKTHILNDLANAT